MILFYLALPIVILAVLRFLVSLFNYLAPPRLPEGAKPASEGLVSVLIVARNEEKRVEHLLVDLLDQSYENLEVLVYDNLSSDTTAQVVLRYSKNNRNIALASGMRPPEGWQGKSYGYHCLAQRAKGDYLLFLDADVRLGPRLIERSLGYMQRGELALLSLFPYQAAASLGGRIASSVMRWAILSLLPLRLVERSGLRLLSAASGKMMMFDAEIYRKHQWHERFRQNFSADFTIARSVKALRYRAAVLLGAKNDIRCHVCASYRDAIAGYSCDMAGFFGANRQLLLAFAAMATLGPILVLLIMPFPLIFAYFFSVSMASMMIALVSKHSAFAGILLLPAQQLALAQMVGRWWHFRRAESSLGNAEKSIDYE